MSIRDMVVKLSDEQLVVAFKNVGVDATCGACMSVFFCGGAGGGEHTCKSPTSAGRPSDEQLEFMRQLVLMKRVAIEAEAEEQLLATDKAWHEACVAGSSKAVAAQRAAKSSSERYEQIMSGMRVLAAEEEPR